MDVETTSRVYGVVGSQNDPRSIKKLLFEINFITKFLLFKVEDTTFGGYLFDDSLPEKCPNTKFFRFVFSCIRTEKRRFTPLISVFSVNTGKYGPEKTPYLNIFHAVIAKYNFFIILMRK